MSPKAQTQRSHCHGPPLGEIPGQFFTMSRSHCTDKRRFVLIEDCGLYTLLEVAYLEIPAAAPGAQEGLSLRGLCCSSTFPCCKGAERCTSVAILPQLTNPFSSGNKVWCTFCKSTPLPTHHGLIPNHIPPHPTPPACLKIFNGELLVHLYLA